MLLRRALEITLFTLLAALLGLPGLLRLAEAQDAPHKGVEERPLVLRGATIHTVSGPVIQNGVIVVVKGKIAGIGMADKVPTPKNAIIRDVTGKVIIPGLVDTHSHVGIFPRPNSPAHQDGNEMTGPVQPGLRALDAITPDDPGIKMALAGGVTTANIMPGSGNAIGGQTLYVKFRGAVIDAMRIVTTRILGGIKFANGENPKGVYGSKGAAPGTRMKTAALQREQFVKARDYQRKWKAYQDAKDKGEKATAPDRDLALDPLVEVLEKRRTVHFHCHRADDIMTAVRLSEEFGFELVLQHCTEGYRVAEELGKRGAWVSLTLLDSPGGKPEAMGLLEENAAILIKAGVKVAINTDDFITESRFLLRTGAIALRGGMTEDQALRALTLSGAEMMHLDDRLGSLDVGKDADFAILSGKPFSIYTQVLETYIDGVKVFDRTRDYEWTYHTGGFAVADRSRLPKMPEATKPLAVGKTPDLPAGSKDLTTTAKTYAVLAGKLHTVSHGTIDEGVVLVEDGKIKQVGKQADVKLPAGIAVLRAAHATPGLIDAFSVVGLSGALNSKKADQDQDELSDPNQADLRALDSFNPNEPLLQFIRENGVTVIHATPGPANVIGGQTGIFRTYGTTADRMTVRSPAAMLVNIGESSKSTYAAKSVSTRMGVASLLRTAFQGASAYGQKKATAKEPPATNLKYEALLPMLEKKLPVYFAAHRASDITTALRLANEFDLRPVLTMVTDGYLIPDILADAKAPIVAHPTMQRPAALEAYNSSLANAAVLADRGLPVAISTAYEGYVPKTRVLRFEAAVAMVNGLGFDRALASITLEPAKILNIADQYGSLEPGKVADIVLYDGDPFEHSTHVTHTLLGGRLIYDRADYLKLPFERRALPLSSGGGSGDFGCCLGAW
ncbi:MAG: amidohydrolase family protein [Planctomycetota bacterium]